MKILFTLDTLANAGAEKSTLEILSHFSNDTQVKVIYFYPGFDLKADFEKAGIPLHFADLKGKRSFIEGVRRLCKIIREEKPDLVVSSIMRADLISRVAGLITGTKIIGTLLSDSYGEMRIKEKKDQKQFAKFRFFWLIDKWTSFIPRYWVSNSLYIAKSNAAALGISKKKIKVIYRGRDTARFPKWKPPTDNRKFRFVFVGRILQLKGLGELLMALDLLRKENPAVHLDIFGDGIYMNQLKQLIKTLQLEDNVTVHGKVALGWQKLYEAHCFILPSWYEGFSGSLIEAMIAGIPIIASDIPMSIEAVTDKKTALLFKVKDHTDLYRKMKLMHFSYDEMIDMGARAREEAISRFDICHIAGEYEAFLKSIVNGNVNTNDLV